MSGRGVYDGKVALMRQRLVLFIITLALALLCGVWLIAPGSVPLVPLDFAASPPPPPPPPPLKP